MFLDELVEKLDYLQTGPQYAERNTNKIENTFNGTFTG